MSFKEAVARLSDLSDRKQMAYAMNTIHKNIDMDHAINCVLRGL